MANNRVIQWNTFSRVWWLYDANHQCVFKSARKIAKYLQGHHKPIYHPLSDIGDHVVVINTKHIAMRHEAWRTYRFHHHTGYPKGHSMTAAWRLHDMDPTQILQRTVKTVMPSNLSRPNLLRRLHLFPEEDVPDDILANVCDQIKQIQPVPKRLDQYTEEEIRNFPKLFDWPEEYIHKHFLSDKERHQNSKAES
ncbi:39S ribosomal protein L13, mitochondrial-like [Mizuhopecten yessoensis]|uniref:39S ribosomal protein L13, mitochondrial-like n=1 Tax=Mizuhopecten yessoensis TaxID=6573 RepID=UPI000B45C63E|nr:39S ribosomal protein L13, mitochondrial-like [Mizuhopecten yessoensis]